MGSIEQRELHILIRSHIICEFHTNFLPFRTTVGEIILHHPLDEIFTINGSPVIGAVLDIQSIYILRTCGGRDAIHHGIRECNILLRPSGKFGILSLHECHESLLCRVAVMLEVIAGKNRYLSGTIILTLSQTLGHISEHSLRLGRIGKVSLHSLIGEVEISILVDIITSFGDGHRHNLGIRVGNLLNH